MSNPTPATIEGFPGAGDSSEASRDERSIRRSRWLTRTVVFGAGFQIMVLEVAGLRVLQASLGSSVIVTGTILALVMVILAAGYAVGGRLARPFASGLVFSGALIVAGLYGQLIAVAFGDAMASWGLSVREQLMPHLTLRSVVPAVLVFGALYGLPTFLLGALTPYLIGSSDVDRRLHLGVDAGTLMAISAGGSIAGTAFSSYLAIPMMGVTSTLASASAILIGMGVLGLAGHWRARGLQITLLIGAPLVAFASYAAAIGLKGEVRDEGTVYQAESHYGQMRVIRRSDPSGRDILVYHPSRVYTHSVLHPSEPLRDTGSLMFLVPGLVSAPRDILVLGSAAGGILRRIGVAFPDASVVGVDIDPAVHRLAAEVFGVDTLQSQLVSSDARMFLNDDERSFDFIIIDLFAGEFIPTHCVSLEFFQLVARKLKPGGAVFLNTNMYDVPFELPESAEASRPLRHVQSTLRAAGFASLFLNNFFHSVFAFREERSVEALRSALVRVLQQTDLLPALRVAAGVAAYTTTRVPDWGDRYRPLTDDWMPARMLERKSNDDAIYSAIRQATATRETLQSVASNEIERAVLAEQLQARSAGRRPMRRRDELYTSLNQVDDARVPIDVNVAARLFRYPGTQDPTEVVPTSAWARLAAAYAEVYALGWNNDHERLIGVLLALTNSLANDPE